MSGGSAAEQATVLQSVREFLQATTLEVCLPRVHLGELKNHDGRYNSVTRQIRVNPTSEELVVAATHELCHAAESQHDLAALAGLQLEEESGRVDREAREDFAAVCQEGPLAHQLLAHLECEGDEGLQGMQAVRDVLYDRPSDRRPAPVWEALATVALSPSETRPDALISCSWDERQDAVIFRYGDTSRAADRLTGEPLTSGFAWAFPDVEPHATPPDFWVRQSAGLELALAEIRWSVGSREARRLIYEREGAWHPIDDCPQPYCLFTVFGEPWAGRLDGDELSWGPWR